MIKHFLILFSLTVPSFAYASDWVLADLSEDPTVWVDVSSISFDKGIGKAWTKIEYSEKQSSESVNAYDSLKSQYKFNCKNRSVALLQVAFYNGSLVSSSKRFLPNEISFDEVIPDSFGDSILTFVCKVKPKN